jgi:hypothetical protein
VVIGGALADWGQAPTGLQVRTFHTRACALFLPPPCRSPSGQSAGPRQTCPGLTTTPRFGDVPTLSTRYQRFTGVQLQGTHLTGSSPAFSVTLTTSVLASAAHGGLEPPPARRSRGALPHLWIGIASGCLGSPSRSCRTIVWAYRQLYRVERAFRELKGPFEMRPVYHWVDRRIRGHIVVCFPAYELEMALRQALGKRKVVSEKDYRAGMRFQTRRGQYLMRTTLKGRAFEVFLAIGMRNRPRCCKAARRRAAGRR